MVATFGRDTERGRMLQPFASIHGFLPVSGLPAGEGDVDASAALAAMTTIG
jgi:hypothetical protein